jgi:Bacterial type II secretion system protein N.
VRWRWAAPVAILVFVYSLVVHLPAANVYGWFAPSPMPVDVSGINGTLGSGQISEVEWHDQPMIQDLRWHLKPLGLLLGHVDVALIGGGKLPVSGALQYGFGGLSLSGFRLGTHITPLLKMAGFAFLPIDGELRVDLDSLELSAGQPKNVQGNLTLHALTWGRGPSAMNLGDYAAKLAPDTQGATRADIHSVSGPLNVKGQASLAADGSYQLDLGIRPQPGAPAQLVQMLQGLGAPDAQGEYHLRNNGRLATGPVHP